jgi:hypothetical protein
VLLEGLQQEVHARGTATGLNGALLLQLFFAHLSALTYLL